MQAKSDSLKASNELFQTPEMEFDAGFIDFLKKLEQRQEMIKVGASLLSALTKYHSL